MPYQPTITPGEPPAQPAPPPVTGTARRSRVTPPVTATIAAPPTVANIIGEPSGGFDLPDYEKNRATLRQAITLQLQDGPIPGATPQMVDPLATAIMRMASDEPSILRLVENDVRYAASLTDTQTEDAIGDGTLTPQSGPIIDAVAQIAWENGAKALWAQSVMDREDSVKGAYQQLDGTEAAALTERLKADVARIAGETDNPDRRIMAEQATGGVGSSEYNGLPAVWTWDKQQGLIFVAQGAKGSLKEVIRLDEGTKIESNVDALEARALAEAGLAHQVVSKEAAPQQDVEWVKGALHTIARELEDSPAFVAIWDRMWGGLDTAFTQRTYPLAEAIAEKPSRDAQKVAAAVDAYRKSGGVALDAQYAIDQMVVDAAKKQMGAVPGGDRILAAEYIRQASELADENPELRKLTEESTAKQVEEQAAAALEGRTVIGESVDSAIKSVFGAVQTYDNWVKRNGVKAADFFADVGYQVGNAVLPSIVNDTDMKEGQGLWAKAWRETDPFKADVSPDIADYFGLTGNVADLALLGSSLVFDPIMWVFGGSKFASKIMRLAMTDGKYADAYLRMPWGRKTIDRIVDAEGVHGWRLIRDTENLLDPQFHELRVLAETKGVDRKLVEDAYKRTFPSTDGVGFNLGLGPTRTRTRSLNNQVAYFLDNLGVVGADRRTAIYQSLAALRKTRAIDVRGGSFITQSLDWLDVLHPNDIAALDRWSDRFYQASYQASAGRDELLATTAARVQSSITDSTAAAERWTVATDRATGVEEQLRLAQQEMYKKRMAGDLTGAADLEGEVGRLAASTERARSQATEAEDLMLKAKVAAEQAERDSKYAVHADSGILQSRAMMEFLAEQGDIRGLPTIAKRDIPEGYAAILDGIDLHDWSVVTGENDPKGLLRRLSDAWKSSQAHTTPRVGQGEALSGSAAMGKQLEDLGVFASRSTLQLPVSPWDIIAYDKMVRRPQFWQEYLHTAMRSNVAQAYQVFRKTFAMNLLINAFTPFVTNLDEVLRFWAVTGDLPTTLKAAAQTPPISSLGGRRFAENVSPQAQQYVRDQLGELGRSSASGYSFLERPSRRPSHEWKQRVERFINGRLGNDPVFREYFYSVKGSKPVYVDVKEKRWAGGQKAAAAPEQFRSVWEDGRGLDAPLRERAGPAAANMSADEAFQIIDNNVRWWFETSVDPKVRAPLRERLIEAATTPRGSPTGRITIESDGRLLAGVNKTVGTPGFLKGKDRLKELFSTPELFKVFYGDPANRRGAIFFDHFDQSYVEMVTEAYTRKGTLLTADRLQSLLAEKGMNYTRDQAGMLLRRGADSPTVRELMRGGYVTESQIEANAAQYAAKRSDELMYTLLSTSMAGTKAEAAMPFVRAQTDFIGWWFDWLTRPSVFRVGLKTRDTLAQSGIGNAALKAMETAERVPLNMRALSRFSHIIAAGQNQFDTGDQFAGLDWAVDKLTFFPVNQYPRIMWNLLPSPLGAISGAFEWGLDRLDATELKQAYQDIWPATQFTEGDNLFDKTFPTSERSLRKALGTAIKVGAAVTGQKPNSLMWDIGGWLSGLRQPVGTSSYQAAGLQDLMRANRAAGTNLVPGSEAWKEAMSRVESDGLKKAAIREGGQTVRGQAKLSSLDPGAPYLQGYSSIIDSYDMLAASGAFDSNMTIDDGGKPRIVAVWEKYQNGTATREDVTWLADTLSTVVRDRARDIAILPGFPEKDKAGNVVLDADGNPVLTKVGEITLQDYLLAKDPALAVNMVSKLQVNRDLFNKGAEARDFELAHAGADFRLQNVPPGPTGRQLRTDAFRRNWIYTRPMWDDDGRGWAADAQVLANRAQRNLLSNLWQQVTGTRWSGVDVAKAKKDIAVTVPAVLADMFDAGGVKITAGETVTLQDLADRIDTARGDLYVGGRVADELFGATSIAGTILHQTAQGRVLLDYMKLVAADLDKKGLSIGDMDEKPAGLIREAFSSAVDLGLLSTGDYARTYQRYFGQLGWQPPVPPPASKLKDGWTIGKADLDKGTVGVVDGDTLVLHLADEDLRVRILGINAPELGKDEGAVAATEMLKRMIGSADEITLGLYKPDVFGVQQLSGPGDVRMVAWLYYNGVPVYDDKLFTPRDPTGAGIGGTVKDLFELYRRRAATSEKGVS